MPRPRGAESLNKDAIPRSPRVPIHGCHHRPSPPTDQMPPRKRGHGNQSEGLFGGNTCAMTPVLPGKWGDRVSKACRVTACQGRGCRTPQGPPCAVGISQALGSSELGPHSSGEGWQTTQTSQSPDTIRAGVVTVRQACSDSGQGQCPGLKRNPPCDARGETSANRCPCRSALMDRLTVNHVPLSLWGGISPNQVKAGKMVLLDKFRS